MSILTWRSGISCASIWSNITRSVTKRQPICSRWNVWLPTYTEIRCSISKRKGTVTCFQWSIIEWTIYWIFIGRQNFGYQNYGYQIREATNENLTYFRIILHQLFIECHAIDSWSSEITFKVDFDYTCAIVYWWYNTFSVIIWKLTFTIIAISIAAAEIWNWLVRSSSNTCPGHSNH